MANSLPGLFFGYDSGMQTSEPCSLAPPPKRSTEILAGITTFLTMSYIIVVNPSILATEGTGMSFTGVMTATVLLAFVSTLLMGLYAKLPFGVAPGMGLNAFFTFSLVLGEGVPWPTTLGCVFWSGVIFVIASVTPARAAIVRAIPDHLRTAAGVGIGLFLALIGLKQSGLVVADPVTLVKLGALDASAGLSLVGLALAAFFMRRRAPYAFLLSIGVVTVAAVFLGLVAPPERLVAMPDFESVFFRLDVWGAAKFSLLPAMVSMFMTDLFDSISTFVGVSQASGMVNEKGEPKNLKQGLMVDAVATLSSGLLGTSPGTAFIESAAGIEAGGRTGFVAVVTAFCFLPFLFIGPLAQVVPPFATAPILILVGSLMFRSIGRISFAKIEDALPAFLTLALIPFSFSITQGILWGFISHGVLYGITGRWKDLKPTMVVLVLVALGLQFMPRT